MRIGHLSTRLDYYGGEVCLANLATGFAGRGHEVSCLVRPGSVLAERLAAENVSLDLAPLVDWFDPGTILRVRRWLRQNRIDILATHLPRDYFIAGVAGRRLPVCNVATRHHLKPLSWPLLKRPFLRDFGAVITVSDAVARVVRQSRLVPPDRVVTVPNGIAAPSADPPRPGLRERCGIAPQSPMVGLVGKLSPEKGAELLLQAVARLTVPWPDLQILLIGDGDDRYRNVLASAGDRYGLKGRVHFCGYVPEAAQLVRELDIQVVASRAEPFGLATLEAMASGVPVVATATGGSPELMRDGVEGFLVPPGGVEALADRLARLLASPQLRRECGQRGRLRFEQHFSLPRMLDETATVYRQALAQRG